MNFEHIDTGPIRPLTGAEKEIALDAWERGVLELRDMKTGRVLAENEIAACLKIASEVQREREAKEKK